MKIPDVVGRRLFQDRKEYWKVRLREDIIEVINLHDVTRVLIGCVDVVKANTIELEYWLGR